MAVDKAESMSQFVNNMLKKLQKFKNGTDNGIGSLIGPSISKEYEDAYRINCMFYPRQN